MKAALFLWFIGTAIAFGATDDVTFTNRIASFTNLQGQLYSRVQLIRGDQDGLIWRDGPSGGRICYTNLDPRLLEYLGISSNRIETARIRAQNKAIADARYRAMKVPDSRRKLPGLDDPTNAPPVDSALDASSSNRFTDASYAGGSMYPPYSYWFPVDPALGPAPRAPSAPSALSAASAVPTRPAEPAPGSGSAGRVLPAASFGSARSAPSAPSAPPPGKRH